ncbi:MAG: response regulator [Desulfobacteraceae bacterium]|nr:MAG: response regulator [Desulfobacteraceae bacterium]
MNKKILIVDDEVHIRALLEQALEDLEDVGVEIFSAREGEEGLRFAKEEKPDLMFLDIMMPKKNGYEVCEEIKGDPELKDIYIIMLTAKGQAADRARGEEVKANEYITKPFNPDEILQKASDILDVQI